jgi:hypothetical protein
MQRYTFYIIWKLLYIFGYYHHPLSGAQTTVSTATGICHTVAAICPYRRRVRTGLSVLWVVYAVDTVVCAPDDEWKYHPKHVEQFPDKINCVTLHIVRYILEYIPNNKHLMIGVTA